MELLLPPLPPLPLLLLLLGFRLFWKVCWYPATSPLGSIYHPIHRLRRQRTTTHIHPGTHTRTHTHTHTHLWLVWNSSSWCCCCFGNCVVFSFSKMDIWPLACPAPRSLSLSLSQSRTQSQAPGPTFISAHVWVCECAYAPVCAVISMWVLKP